MTLRSCAGHLTASLPTQEATRFNSEAGACFSVFRGSSTVERPAVNRKVSGSSPDLGAEFKFFK